MPRPPPSPAFNQYIEEELLRAPVLFDQVAEGAMDHLRRGLAKEGAADRSATSDLIQAIGNHRAGLAQMFTRALRDQAIAERDRHQQVPAAAAPGQPGTMKAISMSLVEEDEVAVDVELSHVIEAIRTTAEHELRELRGYVSALVGDMDVSEDHNPFRPEAYAKALWHTAQGLPLVRDFQMRFLRVAALPLATTLRQSYSSATTRLEGLGIEAAVHRTVIMKGRSLRTAAGDSLAPPDLALMREKMTGPYDSGVNLRYEGQLGGGTPSRPDFWSELARGSGGAAADRKAQELVGRLIAAIGKDERVPSDVVMLIGRLEAPAARLALNDAEVLDQEKHPLWRFIHLLAYEAEMVPNPADPERRRLLRLGKQLIDEICSDRDQRAQTYRRAVKLVEDFLQQRLQRRLTTTATQIGAMQKLEHQLLDGGPEGPDTIGGQFDVPVMDTVMDTVPANLLIDSQTFSPEAQTSIEWLKSLEVGTWVRMFLQGRWVHAQMLWEGDRGDLRLFGDGATDATWAVRRGALLRLHAAKLAKTLTKRSLLARAAQRVTEELQRTKPH